MNNLKRHARIGQFFSVSKEICTLKPSEVKTDVLLDIERNGHTFTDGVGSISPALAVEVASHFNLEFASAFQIRLGGAKGVLQVDRQLEGR